MKMTITNTVCVSQEGPANALALNKDCSQVVIAGRNVFKVFAIGETEFTELSNLRVGKNLNLNYSSIDVAWSAIEENTLATAATNGAVVVWNLGKSGRSKQEHVFSDHKRTVNKVSFHLTEPSLLISGSQDGMMKCFDLRMKEVARTFLSNTESIRDVQFSPLWAHQFAAVSENGNVQLWDVRRHERCLQQFTAHSGPVFACDWHPTAPWLATASRDKTIKVWDMQNKPSLDYTIHTIASVGHVKWRPQKKYHISSCALVLDWSVQVWDVRRPYLPLSTFASHRDVTTCVAWLNSPHAFVATSRDAGLYRHAYSSASHPSLWNGGHALAVGPKSLVAAHPARALPTHLLHANSSNQNSDHDANTQLGRKQPLAGALSPSGQSQLEKIFPESSGSVMLSAESRLSLSLSREPRMTLTAREGQPPSLAAKDNARIARLHDRHLTAHVWEVVSALFAGEAPLPLTNVRSNGQLTKLTDTDNGARVSSDDVIRDGEWSESQFLHSGVLGLPTHTIYIPPDTFAPVSDDGSGWVCAARVHYVDAEATEWTLPEEALTHNKANTTVQPRQVDNNTTVSSKESCSPGGSSGDSVSTQNVFNLKPSNTGVEVCAASLGRRALAQCLRQLAAMGDVATPVHVLSVLGEHRNDLFPYIEESLQEQWLLSYIELLHRKKEYNLATEVIRSAWLPSVSCLSQQSTSVSVHGSSAVVCAVCGGSVRGLMAWCQGCSHGGHLSHLKRWGQTHSLCPAGCGHRCQLPS